RGPRPHRAPRPPHQRHRRRAYRAGPGGAAAILGDGRAAFTHVAGASMSLRYALHSLPLRCRARRPLDRRLAPAVARPSSQESADTFRNLPFMRLQSEVAGIEEAHDRTRIVALEGLGPRWHEERIVLAPDCQKGRHVRAEVLLE